LTEADGADGTRRGAGTRDGIEEAAVDLFARLGYHATSMRAIAEAAGVQPAAIYHWFPAKESILIQLQKDFMERLTGAVTAATAAVERPALKLAAAVREHVVYHGLHPREAFVTDSEIRALSEEARDGLLQSRDEYQEMFRSMIVAGIDDGDLRTSDPSVATYAILLQCTGVALWYRAGGPLELERIADLHVELVLGSLRADGDLISEAVGMTAERIG
jgi:AcrR family transcriptional regulator